MCSMTKVRNPRQEMKKRDLSPVEDMFIQMFGNDVGLLAFSYFRKPFDFLEPDAKISGTFFHRPTNAEIEEFYVEDAYFDLRFRFTDTESGQTFDLLKTTIEYGEPNPEFFKLVQQYSIHSKNLKRLLVCHIEIPLRLNVRVEEWGSRYKEHIQPVSFYGFIFEDRTAWVKFHRFTDRAFESLAILSFEEYCSFGQPLEILALLPSFRGSLHVLTTGVSEDQEEISLETRQWLVSEGLFAQQKMAVFWVDSV
jgi:hypothetical protein